VYRKILALRQKPWFEWTIMARKTIAKLLLILMISLPAGACGVKPNSVEIPDRPVDQPYPRTYPTSIDQ
jgi:hypothetical protein